MSVLEDLASAPSGALANLGGLWPSVDCCKQKAFAMIVLQPG